MTCRITGAAGGLPADWRCVPSPDAISETSRLRVAVYGATRHLGSYVVYLLREAGQEVIAFDIGTNDTESAQTALRGRSGVQLIRPEHPEDVLKVLGETRIDECDVIYFCGMETSPPATVTRADATFFGAERHLLRMLLDGHPRRIVLTSSASVYASSDTAVINEDSLIAPATDAGRHTLALEAMVEAASESTGCAIALLRCAAIAGNPASGVRPVRRLKRSLLLAGTAMRAAYPRIELRPCANNPTQNWHVADLVHVRQAAWAHVLAGKRLLSVNTRLVLNVGNGIPVTRSEVLSAAAGVARIRSTPPTSSIDDFGGSSAALSPGRAWEQIGWMPNSEERRAAIAEELATIANIELYKDRTGEGTELGNTPLGSWVGSNRLFVAGVLTVADTAGAFTPRGLRFEVGETLYRVRLASRMSRRNPLTNAWIVPYVLRIPLADLRRLSTNTLVNVVHLGGDGSWMRLPLPFGSKSNEGAHRRGRIHRIPGSSDVVYLHRGIVNTYLTVRPGNRTDSLVLQARILLARLAGWLWPARTTLMFEKNASTYEESASVLFEALLQRGLRDVRFVLAREHAGEVPTEFRRYLVPRFSFRHFYHFFSARNLFGSERVFHAAEPNTASRALLTRMDSDAYRYVFLQHGVMYMVGLNAIQRRWFRSTGSPGSKGMPPGSKVVCSSHLEARHFVELGGYRPEDLYITGLPKYDRATRYQDANRVFIMLTWRPWEHNLVRVDPDATSYVAMLEEILAAVPQALRDRTYVLPHPLIRSALLRSRVSPCLWPDDSYDEALRTCALLITDYSSIAYDAFYRGANVIFWWKGKDACMRRYGADLMINEYTAFGPVCRDKRDLARQISELYDAGQDEEFASRYRRIVEFSDGRNTERLICALERDGLL